MLPEWRPRFGYPLHRRIAWPETTRDDRRRPGQPGMTGNDRELPGMTGNDRGRPGTTGNDRELPRTTGNDRERPGTTGNDRELPGMTGNDRERPGQVFKLNNEREFFVESDCSDFELSYFCRGFIQNLKSLFSDFVPARERIYPFEWFWWIAWRKKKMSNDG